MRFSISPISSESEYIENSPNWSFSKIPAETRMLKCRDVDLKESFIASEISPTFAFFLFLIKMRISSLLLLPKALKIFSSSFSFMLTHYIIYPSFVRIRGV